MFKPKEPLPDAATCPHAWVEDRNVHPTAKCVKCGKGCMMDTVRVCNTCKTMYHAACFQQMVGSPPASPATVPAYVDHQHELHWTGVLIPNRCDECNDFIGPGLKASLTCLECGTEVHEKCLPKIKLRYTILDKDDAKGRIKESEARNDAAMDDMISMLKRFSEHHPGCAFTALNPVAMKRLQDQHGREFIESCNALKSATLQPQEMKDLRRALRYATAVYGVAYSKGNMSTEASNVLMRVVHRDVLQAKAQDNNAAVMQVLGMPSQFLLYSTWGKDVYEPCYAVIVDDAAKWIVLGFRGSLSDQDFLTDAEGTLTPFCESQAHLGVCTMVDKVIADKQLQKCLLEQRALHPTYKVIVTGHSLGGGLTELFTMRALYEGWLGKEGITRGAGPHDTPQARAARGLQPLARPELSYQCSYLYGYAFAPPPMSVHSIADQFDDVLTSVVAGKDMIPRLQLRSFDRLGALMSKRGAPANVKSESIVAGVDECHISGRVLFATKPNNINTRLTYVDRADTLLHTIYVSTQYMTKNHLMDNYAAALAAVDRPTLSAAAAS